LLLADRQFSVGSMRYLKLFTDTCDAAFTNCLANTLQFASITRCDPTLLLSVAIST
jgi:hypothetical protein